MPDVFYDPRPQQLPGAQTPEGGGEFYDPKPPDPGGLKPGWEDYGNGLVRNTATGQIVPKNHPIYTGVPNAPEPAHAPATPVDPHHGGGASGGYGAPLNLADAGSTLGSLAPSTPSGGGGNIAGGSGGGDMRGDATVPQNVAGSSGGALAGGSTFGSLAQTQATPPVEMGGGFAASPTQMPVDNGAPMTMSMAPAQAPSQPFGQIPGWQQQGGMRRRPMRGRMGAPNTFGSLRPMGQ